MMSIMSGFSFTPIISFICLFFILSVLDFLADSFVLKRLKEECRRTDYK
jgi:hypothetical protein